MLYSFTNVSLTYNGPKMKCVNFIHYFRFSRDIMNLSFEDMCEHFRPHKVSIHFKKISVPLLCLFFKYLNSESIYSLNLYQFSDDRRKYLFAYFLLAILCNFKGSIYVNLPNTSITSCVEL